MRRSAKSKLLQVTLPQTSVPCTEALEQQLDTQLASLREQILMVSGIMSSAVLCVMSDMIHKETYAPC